MRTDFVHEDIPHKQGLGLNQAWFRITEEEATEVLELKNQYLIIDTAEFLPGERFGNQSLLHCEKVPLQNTGKQSLGIKTFSPHDISTKVATYLVTAA